MPPHLTLTKKFMRVSELQKKLDEEGCAPSNYAIESRGSDAYCLMNDGKQWRVFYSERGCDADPIFTTASESEACGFFLDHMRKQPNWHLIGVCPSELEAKAFEREVERLGAASNGKRMVKSGPRE